MGNRSVLWWRWGSSQSQVQGTVVNAPEKFGGDGRTSVGGHGIILGGTGADKIEIHKLRMKEVGNGFNNTFPPLINVDFQINDVVYFRKIWQSRQTPPFVVDLSTNASNTQGSPSGDAPLIVSGGETMRILMTDGTRPSNSDTIRIEVDLWGIRL